MTKKSKAIIAIGAAVILFASVLTCVYLFLWGTGTLREDDFSVSISASQTTFTEGTDITIAMTLRNHGVRPRRITGGFNLMMPQFTEEIIHPEHGRVYNFASASVGINSWVRSGRTRERMTFGARLPYGNHEVIAISSFESRDGNTIIRLHSEPIILNVYTVL